MREVIGFGFWVAGFVFRVSGFRVWVSCPGIRFRVSGFGFRVPCLLSRVSLCFSGLVYLDEMRPGVQGGGSEPCASGDGLCCWVQGLGLGGVWWLGLRVLSLGFRA